MFGLIFVALVLVNASTNGCFDEYKGNENASTTKSADEHKANKTEKRKFSVGF